MGTTENVNHEENDMTATTETTRSLEIIAGAFGFDEIHAHGPNGCIMVTKVLEGDRPGLPTEDVWWVWPAPGRGSKKAITGRDRAIRKAVWHAG